MTAEELQKLEEKLPALQDVAAQAARAIPTPGKSVDPDVLDDLQMATFLASWQIGQEHIKIRQTRLLQAYSEAQNGLQTCLKTFVLRQ